MSSDKEEPEIKIEYNESFETDPLCENRTEKTDESGSRTVNLEKYQVNIEECNDESEHLLENTLNCDNFEDQSNDHHFDLLDSKGIEIQGNNATWYKEIDESGRYLCRFCELTYSTIQTLRHHTKIKHPGSISKLRNAILNNKRNTKLKCHICKTKFKVINELREHIQEKHNVEDVATSCKSCDATFLNRTDMLEHLFHNHNVLKKHFYSCLLCGYRTLKKSHFKQHKNIHSLEKTLMCTHCDYKTNYLPNLRVHERIHNDFKPYICNNEGCEYRSSTKSALRSHQLKHNREENMLYCDKCSYKTVYKQSLNKHTESHSRNCIRIKL